MSSACALCGSGTVSAPLLAATHVIAPSLAAMMSNLIACRHHAALSAGDTMPDRVNTLDPMHLSLKEMMAISIMLVSLIGAIDGCHSDVRSNADDLFRSC